MPHVVRAADATVRGDVGLGYDFTNQLYYEQTFDSTAFTGRTTASNPTSRLVALGFGVFDWGDPTGSRLRIDGRAAAGEKLLQTQLYLDARHRLQPLWRSILAAQVQYRDDSSYEVGLRDFKTSARLGVERGNDDLSQTIRAQYLFDLSRGENEDGTDYFPDYDSHRLAIVYDRFAWSGTEWGAGLTAGHRAFPDTTQRNHWIYTGEGRFRTGVGGRTALEALALAERRHAPDSAAVGDRFWHGDLDVRGRLGVAGEWSIEGRAAWSGTQYDEPSATFIDHVVWQTELGMRYEEIPGRLFRPRFAAQFLRVPDGGGLPSNTPSTELRSAEAEEFDEFTGRLDLDVLARLSWLNLYGAFGRRDYLIEAGDEGSLLARSSYWLVDVGGFGEVTLGSAVRLRLSGDLHYELHDVTSDDLTSLFLSTELRYLFGP